MRQRDQLQTSFLFFENILYFGRSSLGHSIKPNFITFQAIDLGTFSIFIFYNRFGTSFPPHFVYHFQEKCLSCYILLSDQISLSDSFYFLRYWKKCIVIICCPLCDVINFEINLSFHIKLFFYITKESGHKFKYLKNGKSF